MKGEGKTTNTKNRKETGMTIRTGAIPREAATEVPPLDLNKQGEGRPLEEEMVHLRVMESQGCCLRVQPFIEC